MIKKYVEDVCMGYVYVDRKGRELVVTDIFYEKIRLYNKEKDKRFEYNCDRFKTLVENGIYTFKRVNTGYYHPLSVGDTWTLEEDTEYFKKGDTFTIYDVVLCSGSVYGSNEEGINQIYSSGTERVKEIDDMIQEMYKKFKEVR